MQVDKHCIDPLTEILSTYLLTDFKKKIGSENISLSI
jgi:hypothetical protein